MSAEPYPSTTPRPPVDEKHHRDIAGGGARAAVFGVSDGLVSNVGLILGVAGADTDPGIVILAGLAGLISGGISMAAGEFNSIRVQNDLFEREIALERREIARNPAVESVELAQHYQSRGLDADLSRALSEAVMEDPEVALEFHVREELGIAPGELGSAWTAAWSSMVSFTLGAMVPLVPWLVGSGTAAIVASLVAALVAAIVIGVVIARLTETSAVRAVARQVFFTAAPAALAYGIGRMVGVSLD